MNDECPPCGHVWTAPGWQEESSLCSVGRCSHVFGLFARHSWPLPIMPSADQVPVKSGRSVFPRELTSGLISRAPRPRHRMLAHNGLCSEVQLEIVAAKRQGPKMAKRLKKTALPRHKQREDASRTSMPS